MSAQPSADLPVRLAKDEGRVSRVDEVATGYFHAFCGPRLLIEFDPVSLPLEVELLLPDGVN